LDKSPDPITNALGKYILSNYKSYSQFYTISLNNTILTPLNYFYYGNNKYLVDCSIFQRNQLKLINYVLAPEFDFTAQVIIGEIIIFCCLIFIILCCLLIGIIFALIISLPLKLISGDMNIIKKMDLDKYKQKQWLNFFWEIYSVQNSVNLMGFKIFFF
jgi:hypothetical protein